MAETQKPSVGRIVHYMLSLVHDDGPVERPAIIVSVGEDDRVNLQVFLDGRNDGWSDYDGTTWREDVPYGEIPEAGTWHWPERV